MWTTFVGTILALALVARLVRRYFRTVQAEREAPEKFFGAAKTVLDDPRFEPTGSVGLPELQGRYRGHPVRIRAIVDTLAVRKLPALWLMVTIPEPLPIKATFDLMMRPAGPTTFSNFDGLPDTLDPLPDFPLHGVVRSDDPDHLPPAHVISPHLGLFADPHAKELLITPKGARIVWQLGEGSRGAYGIFRQAEFGDVRLEPALLGSILDRLIAIREAVTRWSEGG